MRRGRNRCNIVIYLVFDADLCQRNAFLRVDLLYPSVFNLTNVACGASALFRKVLLPESLRNTEPPNILSKSLVVHCTYLLKHILVDSAAKVKIA